MRILIALVPVALVLIAPAAFAGEPPARAADGRSAAPTSAKPGAKKARRPKKKPEPPPPPRDEPEDDPPAETSWRTSSPARDADPEPITARQSRDRAAARDETRSKDAEPAPISIAPLLGYATTHANLGIGIRGGYTLPMHLYVGGSLVYHFGTSVDVPSPSGGSFQSSVHLLYPGAEVGYEIPVGPVIIRPYAGIGVLLALASSSGGGGSSTSDTTSSLAFWPGCTATYGFPDSKFFVGADTRILIATSGGDPSFGMFATGGMRF